MKKAIYLSTAALLLIFPNISNAQQSTDLSPTEVFCSNLSAKSGNAIRAIAKMTKSRALSIKEKKVLIKMSDTLDRNQTIENICYPAEF